MDLGIAVVGVDLGISVVGNGRWDSSGWVDLGIAVVGVDLGAPLVGVGLCGKLTCRDA